jgi:hypothetical protein
VEKQERGKRKAAGIDLTPKRRRGNKRVDFSCEIRINGRLFLGDLCVLCGEMFCLQAE